MEDRNFDAAKKGKLLVCPICQITLVNSVMGVQSHLTMHVRKNEITNDQKIDFICDILGQQRRTK